MSSVPVVRSEPRAVAVVEQGSITALLHLAVERGTPVAELKELVDLHERMERRQAEKAFAAAMTAFQRKCPQIKKSSTAEVATRTGGKYKYTYAELDEIVRSVGSALAEEGLSYTWDTAVDKSLLTCSCIVRHVDGHSVTTRFTLPTDASSPGMNPQQAVGSALTYARRQSLVAALGLTMTDEDNDGTNDYDETLVSEDQITALQDRVQETGATIGRFLNYLGVASLGMLPARRYEYAMKSLDDMKKRRAEAAT